MTATEELSDRELVAGIERWYSTAEAAAFFDRSSQWLYDRWKKGKLTLADGSPIPVHRIGDGPRATRRYTLDTIAEIAQSLYRAGTLKMPELKIVLRRVLEAREGHFDPSAVDEEE